MYSSYAPVLIRGSCRMHLFKLKSENLTIRLKALGQQ